MRLHPSAVIVVRVRVRVRWCEKADGDPSMQSIERYEVKQVCLWLFQGFWEKFEKLFIKIHSCSVNHVRRSCLADATSRSGCTFEKRCCQRPKICTFLKIRVIDKRVQVRLKVSKCAARIA